MQSYNRLTCDLEIVKSNFQVIQKELAKQKVMPMLKANGYGIGAYPLAKLFHNYGAPIIGTSYIEEAIDLRTAGYSHPLMSLTCPPESAISALEHEIEIGLTQIEHLVDLEKAAKKRKEVLSIHVYVDTGMHRLGLTCDEALQAIAHIRSSPYLNLSGVMSHFSAASIAELKVHSLDQIRQFEWVCSRIKCKPKWIHMGSSCSLKNYPLDFTNLVRLGMLYFGMQKSSPFPIKPALSLTTRICALHQLVKGQHVGYIGAYVEKRAQSRIAVVPIGYHDGWCLSLSGRGFALIDKVRAPYIGRICMDFMMLDVTDIPQARLGTEVVLMGKELLLDEIESWGGASARQILSTLGPRLSRNYLPYKSGKKQIFRLNESHPNSQKRSLYEST